MHQKIFEGAHECLFITNVRGEQRGERFMRWELIYCPFNSTAKWSKLYGIQQHNFSLNNNNQLNYTTTGLQSIVLELAVS